MSEEREAPSEKVNHSEGYFEDVNHVSEHESGIKTSTVSTRGSISAADRARRNLNAKLANPLADLNHAALGKMGRDFAKKYQVCDNDEDVRAFEIGAILAQAPEKYEKVQGLTDEEMATLHREFKNRWQQPKLMYLVIVLCSACAAVQGMGEFSVSCPPQSVLLLMFCARRNCCQRRSDILQQTIWYRRQRLTLNVASGFDKFGPLSLLFYSRMLVDCSFEPLFRPTRNSLHHLHHFRDCLSVAGFRQLVVAHVHRSVCARVGDWAQVRNCSYLCG